MKNSNKSFFKIVDGKSVPFNPVDINGNPIKFKDSVIMPDPEGDDNWNHGGFSVTVVDVIEMHTTGPVLRECIDAWADAEQRGVSPPFRLVVGKTYELQNGDRVKIVERFAKHRGYETVMDEHGCHRYDRSTDQEDTGRVTGTAHDYSCPLNIRRENDKFSEPTTDPR
jgi:hypothetical protein